MPNDLLKEKNLLTCPISSLTPHEYQLPNPTVGTVFGQLCYPGDPFVYILLEVLMSLFVFSFFFGRLPIIIYCHGRGSALLDYRFTLKDIFKILF